MQSPLVYLDQNILGYVQDGSLRLHDVKGVQWVYSKEHFNEIARGTCTSLLSVLEKLKAREIDIILDEKFQITDEAHIHDYSCPIQRYEQYLQTVSEVSVDESLLTDFFTGLLNANGNMSELPDRLRTQVETLLSPFGEAGADLIVRAQDAASNLGDLIESRQIGSTSLETVRRAIGTGQGRVGNLNPENAILALWEIVKGQAHGVTIDQFFGFDPLDKQGFENWPTFLGIVGCYTTLNILGFRPDRGIRNSDKMPNIMSDANHVAHAAFCAGLISEDRRLCGKAKAIYDYLGLGTEVIRIEFK